MRPVHGVLQASCRLPCRVWRPAPTSHHWATRTHQLATRCGDAGEGRKAYVKRNKNDGADAEAIGEADVRPTDAFWQMKSVEKQGQ